MAELGRQRECSSPARILVLLGTRPEAIKLAPVVRALAGDPQRYRTTVVTSGQHADLLSPLARGRGLAIDRCLEVGSAGQTPLEVAGPATR